MGIRDDYEVRRKKDPENFWETISALDEADAAEAWAEDYDRDNLRLIAGGGGEFVLVRSVADMKTVAFFVTGEAVHQYHAKPIGQRRGDMSEKCKELEELRAEVHRLTGELIDKQGRVGHWSDVSIAITELNDALSREKALSQAAFDRKEELTKKLKSAKETTNFWREREEQTDKENDALRTKNSDLTNDLESARKDVARWKERAEDRPAEIAELTDDLTSSNQNIGRLERHCEWQREDRVRLNALIEQHYRDGKIFLGKRQELEAEVERLNALIEQQKTEIKNIKANAIPEHRNEQAFLDRIKEAACLEVDRLKGKLTAAEYRMKEDDLSRATIIDYVVDLEEALEPFAVEGASCSNCWFEANCVVPDWCPRQEAYKVLHP